MAEALKCLLTDESARQRMGREGRLLIEAEYGPERFGQHLRQVYAKVWPEVFPSWARGQPNLRTGHEKPCESSTSFRV
jgi:hypothetical protein